MLPTESLTSRRRRPVRDTNSRPAGRLKRSKVSRDQGHTDPKDFRIPYRLATPSTNRGSEWTPGSGFSESNIEVIDKRKCSKPVTLKAKRSDPISINRGRTLDLATSLEITKSIQEPRVVRTKQGPLRGETRKENGVLLWDTTSTQIGETSRSFQPARNANETFATKTLGKVASSVK